MKEAWTQVDRLQDEILTLKTSRPSHPEPQVYGSHSSRYTDKTRETDELLREADKARHQYETQRRTGPLLHHGGPVLLCEKYL